MKRRGIGVPLPNLDISPLTHSLLSSPCSPHVCLSDAMIQLGEDDHAPRADSMDTEKHSAERWPPDTSPPQNIWWVQSQWIPCTHRWHHLLSPCQRLAGCAAPSRHVRHFKWSPLKQDTLPRVFFLSALISAPFETKKSSMLIFFSFLPKALISQSKSWFFFFLSEIALKRINVHTCACMDVCEWACVWEKIWWLVLISH